MSSAVGNKDRKKPPELKEGAARMEVGYIFRSVGVITLLTPSQFVGELRKFLLIVRLQCDPAPSIHEPNHMSYLVSLSQMWRAGVGVGGMHCVLG